MKLILPFQNIKGPTILITPQILKYKIMEELNHLETFMNISFMSLDEFVKRSTFDFTEQSVFFIMKKYQVKYEIALTYIEQMKFLTEDTYSQGKLFKLSKMKKELDQQGLLIKDNLFQQYLSNKQIVVYGYDYIPTFCLEIFKNYSNIQIIEKNSSLPYTPQIYEFNTLEDEVNFILEKICMLLEKGIEISKIKLTGVTEGYFFTLKRLFDHYRIPINLPIKTHLFDTYLVKRFFELLSDDIDGTLEKLKEEMDKSDIEIYDQILGVLNKYTWCDSFLSIKECLIYTFKHTYKMQPLYDKAVEVVPYHDNFFSDDEYVFLLGFNEGEIPKIYQDEDFLSDQFKREIGIEDSKTLNQIEKTNLRKILKEIPNCIITYKLKSPFAIFYPSPMIEELEVPIKADYQPQYNYSHQFNQLTFAKQMDDLNKYGVIHPDLVNLYETYPKPTPYDNKYVEIETKKYHDYINHSLNLSYTKINSFYECGFKYYLTNVLKLDIFEDSFAIFIGKLFHYVLSFAFLEDFNFEKVITEFYEKEKRVLTPKENFLLIKLVEELKFIVDAIKEQYNSIGYSDAFYEEEIIIEREEDIKITFKGLVDKILYKKITDSNSEDVTYVVIVDYKTGNVDIALDDVTYGLNMQLPVYLYLVKHLKKLPNVKFYGFYYQPLLANEKKVNPKKSYQEVKLDHLKLNGYSLSECPEDAEFDKSKSDSKVIKSMRRTNDGSYYQYAKVLTEEEIEKIVSVVEERIENSIKEIKMGKFHINPKVIKEENKSCKYCRFKDICYVSYPNFLTLENESSSNGDLDE